MQFCSSDAHQFEDLVRATCGELGLHFLGVCLAVWPSVEMRHHDGLVVAEPPVCPPANKTNTAAKPAAIAQVIIDLIGCLLLRRVRNILDRG